MLRASPVIEFTDLDGNARRFTEQYGQSHPMRPGTAVTVRYDPGDPSVEPVLDAFRARMLLPLIFLGSGLLVLFGLLGYGALTLLGSGGGPGGGL